MLLFVVFYPSKIRPQETSVEESSCGLLFVIRANAKPCLAVIDVSVSVNVECRHCQKTISLLDNAGTLRRKSAYPILSIICFTSVSVELTPGMVEYPFVLGHVYASNWKHGQPANSNISIQPF